jgi:hypothetical protein
MCIELVKELICHMYMSFRDLAITSSDGFPQVGMLFLDLRTGASRSPRTRVSGEAFANDHSNL